MQDFTYVMDARGLRERVTDAQGRTTDYSYDLAGRLTNELVDDPIGGVQGTAYAYDAVDNRVEVDVDGMVTAAAFDDNDRMTSEGATTFTHDANGNMVGRADGASTTAYTYDTSNRLTAVDDGTDHVTHQYDAEGHLVRSTDGGAANDLLVDTSRPLAHVVAEITEGGTATNFALAGDRVLGQQRDGATSLFHLDGLGSVRSITDELADVTDTYDFSPYGQPRASTGTTINPYGFAGQRTDATTGLQHLRTRWYNPSQGRFLTMDDFPGSVDDPGSLHRYVYAFGDPINRVDPTGQMSAPAAAATIGLQGTLSGIAISTYTGFTLGQLVMVVAAAVVISCAGIAAVSTVTALASQWKCDVTNFNVLYPGAEHPATTLHISTAIALGGKPAVLDRGAHGGSRSWLRSTPPCKGNRTLTTGLSCDEYPFHSTLQGGRARRASLALVPIWEQWLQGGILGAFYRACNVTAGHPVDEKFGVVPVGGVGRWVCK